MASIQQERIKTYMFYKEFKFQNFKGIEDMKLVLKNDVTTLIGLNESGKTTILEALYCFEYGAEDLEAITPDIAFLHDHTQWIPIARRADFNDDISIYALVGLNKSDKIGLSKFMKETFNLTLSSIPDEIGITEVYEYRSSRFTGKKRTWGLVIEGTKGRQRYERSYEADSTEWQSAVAHLTRLLPRIWYFPNFLFELPAKFLITDRVGQSDESDEDHEQEEEATEKQGQDGKDKFYRSIFENILRQTAPSATLQSHIVERLTSGLRSDQRNLDALLLAMSESVTETIFEGWNRIFGRATPSAQEVHIGVELAEGDVYVELRIKGPDGYYDLSERSLGFRWFFMYILMTSLAGNAKPDSKPLILLDEPASNLHSSAQAELLKSFENLLDRCHLVYSTHSQHLINIRWLDSAYVVKNNALGSLEIADYLSTRMGARTSITATKYRQFVATHPNQTSYFQPVLDLLDYRPSSLEPVPNVVLVEGKSDFYLLRYMNEILGIDSPVRTVPGTGAGSLDAMIQLHIGWGKSFLILLDGDTEGIKQRERYERKFGSLVEARCVLLPEICSDATVKEAEDLLAAPDKTRLTSAIYPVGVQRPVEKKALSQAIAELYARKQAISVSAPTVRRFRQMFLELQQRLG
jgi:ABC-type Mn2+/Zn2+ transport system ATPase subunit